MRKYIQLLSLMLICAPMTVRADDACTHPEKYTTDRRCYVTDAQKKQAPYNAVVSVEGTCTGTLVRETEFAFLPTTLLFTAAHCTDGDDDNKPDKTLQITLQDGRSFDVEFVSMGKYDLGANSNTDQERLSDWAIYKFPISSYISTTTTTADGDVEYRVSENIPHVESVMVRPNELPRGSAVSVVGYGTLKIMSDDEISEFQNNYIEYLNSQGVDSIPANAKEAASEYGMYADINAVSTEHAKVTEYIKHTFTDPTGEKRSVKSTITDLKLKMSQCRYQDASNPCQAWGGNSGGPTFDTDGNIVGIVSSGYYIIGGEWHANLGNVAPATNAATGTPLAQLRTNLKKAHEQNKSFFTGMVDGLKQKFWPTNKSGEKH